MIMRIGGSGVLVGILMTPSLLAQTAPCGRILLLANEESGSPSEARFIPAAPEHVEVSVLKALPAVGALLEKRNGPVLYARTDGQLGGFSKGLYGAWHAFNEAAGIKGMAAGTTRGKWTIELRPEKQGGTSGTQVKIIFDKGKGLAYGKNGATPLMNEVECLSGLLSPGDPVANPRGPGPADAPSGERTLTLAEGTPLKVVLRDPWSSKDIAKTASQAQLVFEVGADVDVEDATVIRKGALGVGRFTQVKAAAGSGKGATMEFVIDHVTAVDGQSVSVVGDTQGAKGRRVYSFIGPLFKIWTKGYDALLRAGTTFEVEVSGTHSIRAAK